MWGIGNLEMQAEQKARWRCVLSSGAFCVFVFLFLHFVLVCFVLFEFFLSAIRALYMYPQGCMYLMK